MVGTMGMIAAVVIVVVGQLLVGVAGSRGRK